MTTLGFFCAAAGVLAAIPTARNVSRASPRFRRTVMSKPPRCMKIEDARRRTFAVRHGLRCDPHTRDTLQAEILPTWGFAVSLCARNGGQQHGAGATGCKSHVSIAVYTPSESG